MGGTEDPETGGRKCLSPEIPALQLAVDHLQPKEHPTEQPIEHPMEQPMEQPVEHPVEHPVEQLILRAIGVTGVSDRRDRTMSALGNVAARLPESRNSAQAAGELKLAATDS